MSSWPEFARAWSRALVPIALLALAGCAAMQQRAVLRFSEERLARARALHAEERAPVSFQRFVAARERAQAAAPESAERADYVSEARLWLEAAVDEAERIEISQKRLEREREIASWDEAFLKAERAQNALEDQRAREAAAVIAREEAQRALARAALLPAQRGKLSANDSERAALSLLQRAELVALALPAETDAQALGQLTALLKEARTQLKKAPEQALTLADQALFRGLSLLGTLRALGPVPSPESQASLVEALQLIGAQPTRNERGLSASLPASGAGETRQLERLCTLASAYPVGLVQVILAGRTDQADAVRRLAERGCTGERFRVSVEANQKTLSFVFTAY